MNVAQNFGAISRARQRALCASGHIAERRVPVRAAGGQAVLLSQTVQVRQSQRCAAFAHGSMPSCNVEEAKQLLDRGGAVVLDVRLEREYDQGHITKPARSSFNAPLQAATGGLSPRFVPLVRSKFPNKAASIIVMCGDGGELSGGALEVLGAEGYTNLTLMEGGYSAWTQVWSPSGKRKPPPGRWVSTGKEALKSGLNIPGVAESYDEGGNLTQARFAKGFDNGQGL